jgi:hypothetical protein
VSTAEERRQVERDAPQREACCQRQTIALRGRHGQVGGETLVIDTIAFEPNPCCLFVNIPSSGRKHTVERLTLTDDHMRLR